MTVTLPCSAERWPLFSRLLDEALSLPETGYDGWLAALEGESATLRPALARVLTAAAGPATGGFLDAPALPPDTGLEAGAAVGPFRLVRRLGEGGMGEVWLADRAEDGPRRQVALKLPHAFLLGAEARTRFQRERDVLATLTHPNIAQLYEAGVSSDNVPYLALEYVDGTPITLWCRETSLALDGRLALAEKVLEALGHAHGRLIVHRDIKPSNILVTGDGQVKLLDFGIAKLLGDTAEAGGLTQPAARMATPDYAAPEQLRGDAVTVATDLFGVGAVLFELVAGARPFPSAWRSPDQEAPLASTRADPKAAGSALGARLARALRGDLDAILAKALAPDPAKRYPSADAFARDLACFRAGKPVSARRVGWLTRAGKFVRRQPLATALAVAFLLAVSAGVGGVVWQADRAERAAARANVIKDFLISVFQEANPRALRDKPPGEVTAKELLDAATTRVDSEFAGDAKTRLEILARLADIYEFLEDVPRAEALEAHRIDLTRGLYGPNNPVTLRAMIDKAWDDAGFLEYGKAKSMLAEIRDRVPAVFGSRSHERGVWLMEWAFALQATPGARAERRGAASEAAAILGSERPVPDDYPTALDDLGRVEMASDRFAQALQTLNAFAAADRSMGEFDPVETMLYDTRSAEALQNLGRPDEAERRYREAARLAERTTGRHSTRHFQALARLADLLHQRGQREEADRIFEIIEGEAARSDTPPGQAMVVEAFHGRALEAEGRPAAAARVLESALRTARVRPQGVADLPLIQQALGDAQDQLGHRAEAGPFLAGRPRDLDSRGTGRRAMGARRARTLGAVPDGGRGDGDRRGRMPGHRRGCGWQALGACRSCTGRSGAPGSEARRSRRGAGRERRRPEHHERGHRAVRRQELDPRVARASPRAGGRGRRGRRQGAYKARP